MGRVCTVRSRTASLDGRALGRSRVLTPDVDLGRARMSGSGTMTVISSHADSFLRRHYPDQVQRSAPVRHPLSPVPPELPCQIQSLTHSIKISTGSPTGIFGGAKGVRGERGPSTSDMPGLRVRSCPSARERPRPGSPRGPVAGEARARRLGGRRRSTLRGLASRGSVRRCQRGPVIIEAAINGITTLRERNPNVPILPSEMRGPRRPLACYEERGRRHHPPPHRSERPEHRGGAADRYLESMALSAGAAHRTR